MQSFCLDSNDIIFDIIDLFIIKYESNKQNSLDFHTDESLITVNILLNDISEFEGGGTKFFDNITYNLNVGDMIIHSSKQQHSGLKITKGKRYVLVFFINLYDKMSINNS